MKKGLYITTTLPYVNADPHIGFALEIIQADCLARAHRLQGDKVFFNTGTDEHGQKIFQKAQEQGKDTQEYVDYYAERFQSLKDTLGLSYDAFIRTTNHDHVAAAQEMWRRCERDIYKKKYTGLYCVGDEMFMRDSDLVDGKCPNHPNMELQEIEEENYFFRLSDYQEKLLEYLKGDVIMPEWRKREAIAFVEQGLEDFSISRETARMSWGVPVPGDDTQVMYVWFDALTNYISTLDWPNDTEGNFDTFWKSGLSVQVAGKDQVRFQSLMWQSMLMSANIPTTDRVYYHGFITSGGQKMSKSLGNVIDPLAIVEEYGTDALRYYLLREVPSFEDGDFTEEKFKEAYNANLANGIGNLVSRVMKMAVNYEVQIDVSERRSVVEEVVKETILDDFTNFQFQKGMDRVWDVIGEIDSFISEQEPYKKIKVDESGAKEDVKRLLYWLYDVSVMLEPALPHTAENIQTLIKEHKTPTEPLFARK